jgi:hypothetical protein
MSLFTEFKARVKELPRELGRGEKSPTFSIGQKLPLTANPFQFLQMSDRQRLITKYVANLTVPMATKYYFHFLHNESDGMSPSRHMVIEALNRIVEETHNPVLQTVIKSIPQAGEPGLPPTSVASWAGGKAPKQTEADRGPPAPLLYSTLYISESLTAYERMKSRGPGFLPAGWATAIPYPFYRQRGEIALVLGNYPEALSLGRKAGDRELFFASAVSLGEFDLASTKCTDLLAEALTERPKNTSLISSFELAHLIIYVGFATMTCDMVGRLADQLFDRSKFELGELFDITGIFVRREFHDFINALPVLEAHFMDSLFVGPVHESLITAIKMNVLVNLVKPHARIRFEAIQHELTLERKDVVEILRKKIREGKVRGKLDLVENEFLGGDEGMEGREMRELFERAMIVKESFAVSQWAFPFACAHPIPIFQ